MTWDVTVADTLLASSYLAATSTAAAAAAEGAANRKEIKYQVLASSHSFIPLAFETLGPINAKGITFFPSWVVASQLSPVTSGRLRSYSRDCLLLSNVLTPVVSTAASRSKQTPTFKHFDTFLH
jgi:hypothetical protein